MTGRYALALSKGLNMGLEVLDISDAARPKGIGQCATAGIPLNVRGAGHYAYVMNRGMNIEVVDFGDPAHPVGVGRFAARNHVGSVLAMKETDRPGAGTQAATGFFAGRPRYRRRDDTGFALNRGLDRRAGVVGSVIPVHAIPLPHRQHWLHPPQDGSEAGSRTGWRESWRWGPRRRGRERATLPWIISSSITMPVGLSRFCLGEVRVRREPARQPGAFLWTVG